MAALVLALRPVLDAPVGIDGPSFTSIFQGATRWNTFVGLSVAGSLFGQRGIALIAVAIAAMVPLLNLLAFYVFIRFAGQPAAEPVRRSCAPSSPIPSSGPARSGFALNLLAPPLPKPLGGLYRHHRARGAGGGPAVVGAGLDIRSARPARACRTLVAGRPEAAAPAADRRHPGALRGRDRRRSRGGDHRRIGALRQRRLRARPPDGRQRAASWRRS